jgi:DUF1680 family protein
MDSADNDFDITEAEITDEQSLEEDFNIAGMQVKRLHIPGRVSGKEETLKFIPYWSWGNRGPSDVVVWVKMDSKSNT